LLDLVSILSTSFVGCYPRGLIWNVQIPGTWLK
jgi:hypothetical protein